MSPTVRVGRRRQGEWRRGQGGTRLTIDELAERSGLTARTIRSYQTQGMLPPPQHQGRVAYYDDAHVERLALISQLRDEGLALSDIQDVIAEGESAQRGATLASPRPRPLPFSSPADGHDEGRPSTVTPYRPAASHAPTGAGQPEERSDARRVRLATVVVGGLVLAVVVAVSMFLVLRDAAADRARLARQISALRDELSRLAQERAATPTTVPIASPPPTPPASPPPVPTTSAPPAPVTRVIPVPAESPPPTVVVNPPPPPAQPTCTTLPILNRCL